MTDQLRSLNELHRDQSWPTPEQLRATAGRRRRRRRAAVAGVAGVAAAALVVTLVQVNSGPSRSPVRIATGLHTGQRSGPALQLVSDVKPLSDPSASQSAAAVAQAEQEFALALLKQTNSSSTQDNVALSPSSLSIALAMLQNGASGETRTQIAKVLHTVSLSNDQQDAGWASLTSDLTKAAKQGYTLESANSLWLQQNLPMQQPFMDAMARYFQAGVWQVDFARNLAGATKALNDWVDQQTHGKITKLFNDGDIDNTTLMVLANAVYFKANWKYEFDPKQTVDGSFTLPDGKITSVPFMSVDLDRDDQLVRSSYSQGVIAAQLPYKGDRLAAVMIMPTKQSLTSYVDGLDPSGLHTIINGMTPGEVKLSMPKFHIEQYTSLNETLSALGMPKAFTPAAEFPNLSPVAMQIQSAVQRVYLDVDETGTEAAAVTGIGMVATSASIGSRFDHPFLFLIRDTVTGTILFSAEVQHPGQ